jgi:hypothetical protein
VRKKLEISSHKAGSRSGNNAVEKDFGYQHFGSGCSNFVRVVAFVAASKKSCAIGVCLLWSHGTDKAAIGYILLLIAGDFVFTDKFDGIGANQWVALRLCWRRDV